MSVIRGSVEQRHERQLLDVFVAEAAELAGVREIWIESGEAIEVTIVVDERDDLAELRLFAMFHTLSQSRTRPRCGELTVVSVPSASPPGTQLLVRQPRPRRS